MWLIKQIPKVNRPSENDPFFFSFFLGGLIKYHADSFFFQKKNVSQKNNRLIFRNIFFCRKKFLTFVCPRKNISPCCQKKRKKKRWFFFHFCNKAKKPTSKKRRNMGHAQTMEPQPTVSTSDVVANLDLTKYSGTWFEIARLPLVWENACQYAEAVYEFDMKDQVMNVSNICLNDKNYEIFRRTGVARRANDNSTNGKLLLNFTDNLPSDGESSYWVLLTDYVSYAVVGNDKRDKLWVLSRTKNMSECTYRGIINKLARMGHKEQTQLELHKNILTSCKHTESKN